MTVSRRAMSSFWEKSNNIMAWSAVNGVAMMDGVLLFPAQVIHAQQLHTGQGTF